MEDKLIEILNSFGFPVKLQGSLGENEAYPDHFFTFWNNSSESDSFYDNDEHAVIYDYDVNFYSISPEMTYSVLREARGKLKQAGFIVSGDGHSVYSDEQTHDGRGISVTYKDYKLKWRNA